MKRIESKRALQMFELRLKLAALGAKIVEDNGAVVGVQCPAKHRDEVVKLMNEHDVVTQ